MSAHRDLTGQKFGRLTAVMTVGLDKQGKYIWRCQCECGGWKNVRSRGLVQGRCRSCGCLRYERQARLAKEARERAKRAVLIDAFG